jgi:hypothetical protein
MDPKGLNVGRCVCRFFIPSPFYTSIAGGGFFSDYLYLPVFEEMEIMGTLFPGDKKKKKANKEV